MSVKRVIDGMAGKIVEYDTGGKFSKGIVALSFITIIIFTATVFVFSWYYRPIPDSLIYSFFAAMSVELGALAGIRVSKQRVQQNNLEGGYDQWTGLR